MSQQEMTSVNEHGVSIVMKTTHNKAVEQLLEELDGHYYKIMYPRAKKEVKNAH